MLLMLALLACKPARPVPEPAGPGAPSPATASDGRSISLTTWNIQKGVYGLDPIIDELRSSQADLAFLQETTRSSSRRQDQAKAIAAALKFEIVSECGRLDREREQCIAILSRFPLRSAQALRAQPDRAYALSATVDVAGPELMIVCVHLAGTWKLEATHILETFALRQQECEHLAAWIERQTLPLIVAGDFNPIGPAEIKRFEGSLRRVTGVTPTFPSEQPAMELDRVFYSRALGLLNASVRHSGLSDHLPIRASFLLPAGDRD